jgi:hypothetical protein
MLNSHHRSPNAMCHHARVMLTTIDMSHTSQVPCSSETSSPTITYCSQTFLSCDSCHDLSCFHLPQSFVFYTPEHRLSAVFLITKQFAQAPYLYFVSGTHLPKQTLRVVPQLTVRCCYYRSHNSTLCIHNDVTNCRKTEAVTLLLSCQVSWKSVTRLYKV